MDCKYYAIHTYASYRLNVQLVEGERHTTSMAVSARSG